MDLIRIRLQSRAILHSYETNNAPAVGQHVETSAGLAKVVDVTHVPPPEGTGDGPIIEVTVLVC